MVRVSAPYFLIVLLTITYCRASPRLKDADIPPSEFPDLYAELILLTRKLFHDCKLVHADLSEYNILYHVEPLASTREAAPLSLATAEGDLEASQQRNGQRGHLYIIDVSQSVEHDHPHAFDFLRSDLRNVEDFFSKRGVHCLGLRRAFEFVIRERLEHEDGDEAALRAWLAEDTRLEEGGKHAERLETAREHEDAVFMQSFIPRTLNEVYDPERDVGVLTRGEGEKLIYKDTIGIVTPKESNEEKDAKPGVRFEDAEDIAESEGNNESDEEESEAETSASHDEGNGPEFRERKPRGHRHEDKEAKKVRHIVTLD